jgi:hypothetical protein
MRESTTLTAVIIDVGVVGIVLDSLVEALKSHLGVTLFHMDAGDLDPALRKGRNELDRLQQIFLGTLDVANEESAKQPSDAWDVT